MTKIFYTKSEVMTLTGYTSSYIDKLTCLRKIPFEKNGKTGVRRFPVSEINSWLKSRRTVVTSAEALANSEDR